MTTTVKTFSTPVEDKKGWDFPNAFVAIWWASETSQNTFTSDDDLGDYVEGMESHVIAYTANFWGTKQQQLNGLDSCPLFDKVFVKDEENEEDNGHYEFNEVFTVDLDHLQSEQVLNSSMSSKDKIFRLIELDLTRKFKR